MYGGVNMHEILLDGMVLAYGVHFFLFLKEHGLLRKYFIKHHNAHLSIITMGAAVFVVQMIYYGSQLQTAPQPGLTPPHNSAEFQIV
jgi:hypothetical protein